MNVKEELQQVIDCGGLAIYDAEYHVKLARAALEEILRLENRCVVLGQERTNTLNRLGVRGTALIEAQHLLLGRDEFF